MVYNKKKCSPLRLAKIEKSLGSFKAMSDYMIRLPVFVEKWTNGNEYTNFKAAIYVWRTYLKMACMFQ